MYQEYYQLLRDPFRLAPDPRFRYRHPSFDVAYRHLQESLQQEECFALVAARPGTGKSTLIASFVAELDPTRYQVGILNTTQVEPTELLRMIAFAYGLSAEGLDRATVLHRLEAHWKGLLETGRRALLIVDEAQGLDVASLEQLRLLSNLQHGDRALVQIFLIGQEQLHALLDDPRLERLQQRIVGVCRLETLNLAQVRDYVYHRLVVAGWRGDPQIDPQALVLMHRFSQGLPRYVNRLGSRLLLHGALEKKHRLGAADMAAVLLDLNEELLTPVHEQEGPEGGSNRDLLFAVASGQTWQERLSPQEQAFLERSAPLTAPQSPENDVPARAEPTPATGRDVPGRAQPGTWWRWSAAAAVLALLALPLALRDTPWESIAAAPELQDAPLPAAPRAAAQPAAQPDPGPPAQQPASASAPTRAQFASFVPLPTSLAVAPMELAETGMTRAAAANGAANPAGAPADESTRLQVLLEKAERAYADDRLTIPRGDSAYGYLLQARALDPDHPAITAGLDRVAQRYAVLARWWLDQGDYGKAVRLIERGFEVRSRHPALHAVRRDMHALVLRSPQPSPLPSAFDDEGSSEGTAGSEPALAESAPQPDLLRRLKAFLSGAAQGSP